MRFLRSAVFLAGFAAFAVAVWLYGVLNYRSYRHPPWNRVDTRWY